MNDGIENNDEQTSNQVLGTHKFRQGLVRSLSASSSSSFDSCSDLLGSLENTEEKLEDPSNFPHTDCRDIEPKDDDSCDRTLPESERLLGSVPPKRGECNMKNETLLDPDVKDDALKVESTTVKDHVYGLSNAISFSKVKFLAENTVERISQLQTSFRLPTSYIFPLKNVLQTDNTHDSDAQTSAATEVSDINKEHFVEKESSLRAAGDGIVNIGRRVSTETSTLLPKQLGDVLPMPHTDASIKSIELDAHTEGFSMQQNPSPLEQGINSVFSENSLIGEDINGSAALIRDNLQISGVPTGNTVPIGFGNSVATADASSRGSEIRTSKHSQSLQEPVAPSDFRTQSPAFCHPLRTLSSGSGRPDLEEAANEQNMDCRVLPKGPPVDLFDTAPISADALLNIESHVRLSNEADINKGFHLDGVAYITGIYQSSSEPNAGSSTRSCTNQGREPTWCDHPILEEAMDRANSECRQGLSLEEREFGDNLHEEKWKDLSIRLQSKLQSDQREKTDGLGPEELCRYVENLELNETYVDTVLDMEDVLLDCDEHGIRERFMLGSSSSVIGTPRSSRDGSLSSSTSGLQLFTLTDSVPFTVDWVEVVGAKQRRGGSSFGERIVGVKDHTVYCIKVSSGNQEWEVLRRYRDFVDLYHQLRRKFNVRTEKSLPPPWKEVDRDSRKVFGNTHPNVVEVRSSRIEKCLQSLLQAGPPFSTSSPLCWFLCPQSSMKGFSSLESHQLTSSAASQQSDVQLGSIESPYLQSPRSELGSRKGELDYNKSSVSLGKTVKLNLKTHPNKNMKQLLSSQHHSCAGCYKHLEAERGLVHGFVQTLGWGKPRLCEYSGQLYCTSCHLNETAVLPAQVLWHWDFTPRRVSQLAKAYLDSIYDQVFGKHFSRNWKRNCAFRAWNSQG